MLPRLKLIQCFTCKNNLDCWGLKEDIPLGRNEQDFIVDKDLIIQCINDLSKDEELNAAEYYGIISGLFLQALRFDREVKRRDVYQLISVLCASCNCDDHNWACPAEDEKDEENWSYEPRND